MDTAAGRVPCDAQYCEHSSCDAIKNNYNADTSTFNVPPPIRRSDGTNALRQREPRVYTVPFQVAAQNQEKFQQATSQQLQQPPEADPQNPEADPQNPEADLQNPEADPQNPEGDPQNPEADPQNPEADPQNPDADEQNLWQLDQSYNPQGTLNIRRDIVSSFSSCRVRVSV